MRLTASVFADRAHQRHELREDGEGAGLRILGDDPVAALLTNEAHPLGDVVLLDCPQVDGGAMAALSRLDMRAARAGAQLIVSTSVDALDDVFGCLDQCEPQILVAPSRAERLVALGQVMTRMPGRKVRELSDQDRIMLLRLTEQVTQMAERMDRIGGTPASTAAPVAPAPAPAQAPSAFRFDGARAGTELAEKAARPQLPDPRMVRKLIRQRQMRARFFEVDLFADPAWDMLLDLTAAKAENAKVSVTSLCIASGVPPTTALRWIGQMTEAGLLRRIEDETDRRRAFITLTDKAADAMSAYFAELGANARVI
ncbi:winged helix DNA-binding protein [Novosphingobium ovatum]|nr:winged helix DNA-binding protein [Novosphingobium ovatum]